MPIYHVVITGHLDKWKLPPNGALPDELHQVFNYDVQTLRQVSDSIDDRIAEIVGCGAMKAFKEPNRRDLTKLEDSIMAPLHMFTHFTFKVTTMNGDLAVYKEGKSVLKDGKEVVKN